VTDKEVLAMKKDVILKEFVRSLSDDDIRFVCFRLSEKKSGDLGEVVEFIQQDPEIDRVLASAKDSTELYDLIDEIYDQLDREWKRRVMPR
jgi:hypothetical protein